MHVAACVRDRAARSIAMTLHAPRRVPSESVILALTRAGISRTTAIQMDAWKAQEVLDLLHERAALGANPLRGGPRLRGTLGTR